VGDFTFGCPRRGPSSGAWHIGSPANHRRPRLARIRRVSLAAAREKRDELQVKLRAGEGPRAKPEPPKPTMTLKVASETYWDGQLALSEQYRKNAKNAIEAHLGPDLGDRDLGSITRDDLLVPLNRMDAQGLLVYVRKVRMWVGQVFDWGVETSAYNSRVGTELRPDKTKPPQGWLFCFVGSAPYPGECVLSQSLRALFIRVCQPLPVARKALRTSSSNRIVVADLRTAATDPAGRPRRRAAISSGVWTWACLPLTARQKA